MLEVGFIPSGDSEAATGGLGNDFDTFNLFVELVNFHQSKHTVSSEGGISCTDNVQLLGEAFELSMQMCLV